MGAQIAIAQRSSRIYTRSNRQHAAVGNAIVGDRLEQHGLLGVFDLCDIECHPTPPHCSQIQRWSSTPAMFPQFLWDECSSPARDNINDNGVLGKMESVRPPTIYQVAIHHLREHESSPCLV